MTEVRGVVRRDATGIDQHLFARLEGHHRLLGGVEQTHRHAGDATASDGAAAGLCGRLSRWSPLMPVSLGATRVL